MRSEVSTYWDSMGYPAGRLHRRRPDLTREQIILAQEMLFDVLQMRCVWILSKWMNFRKGIMVPVDYWLPERIQMGRIMWRMAESVDHKDAEMEKAWIEGGTDLVREYRAIIGRYNRERIFWVLISASLFGGLIWSIL